MTPQQDRYIRNAVKCLQDARKWMDQAMYYTGDPMPDSEFTKMRTAYDSICKAVDRL